MPRSRRRAIVDDCEEPSTSQEVSHCAYTGKIKSVYCKDFVTYTECVFYPTEYLNVIIGPNGTGKSTLVAAIVLGLGGKPELLSRSSSIGDYVKNGHENALIKVEIYREKPEKTRTFQRSFGRTNKSIYKVDEEEVSERNFLSAVAQYQIQISNLCQFLPQDRVQDFAKMDAQTIFVNTVKSVCSREVIEQYEELKRLRAEQVNENNDIRKSNQRMAELRVQLDKMQQDLQRYSEQQVFQNKLDVCEAKKLQLQAEALKQSMEQCFADFRLAKEKLQKDQQEEQEIVLKQSGITRTTQMLKSEVEEKTRVEHTLATTKTQIEDKIKQLKDAILTSRANYQQKEREQVNHNRELQNESNMLKVILQDLSNARNKLDMGGSVRADLAQCEQTLQNLKARLTDLVHKRSNINAQLDDSAPEIGLFKRRIDQANNIKDQKLQLIRDKFPDVYKAVQWLRSNREQFEGHVYDPVMLELNVCNAAHAKYFENTIAMRDLQSFICERKSDVSKLVGELCMKKGLSINVAHTPPANKVRYAAEVPINKLKHLGFTAYLIDLVDGPPAILNYLCSMNALHRIPIGSADVSLHTDSIPTSFSLYFGGDQRYAVSVSKYTREHSVRQNHIKTKGVLCSVDLNEIRKTELRLKELIRKSDDLKNERTSLESQIGNLNAEREEVLCKKRAIAEQLATVTQLEDKCKRQKAKVEQLKNTAISLPELEQQLTGAVHKCLQKIMAFQKEKVRILEQLQHAIADKKYVTTKMRIYELENEQHKHERDEVKERVRQAQTLLDTIKNSLATSKRKYESKLVEAREARKSCKSIELFNELPDNLDELREAINEYRGRLECMNDVDPEIINSYKQKCAEVEDLEHAVEERRSDHLSITAKIDKIHRDWYPQIDRIVQTLNTHFGDFMTSMGYVGEVNLTRTDDCDYNSYGIQIMVQYRKNAPLQTLDRHVQSGGERAVAIATYTLSLQHITHVPFRCVDEINQGMDAKNERKIFEMLVRETTQTGRSQYFFITPKLLPNLQHNERMTVHIVFNGKMIQSMDVFSSKI